MALSKSRTLHILDALTPVLEKWVTDIRTTASATWRRPFFILGNVATAGDRVLLADQSVAAPDGNSSTKVRGELPGAFVEVGVDHQDQPLTLAIAASMSSFVGPSIFMSASNRSLRGIRAPGGWFPSQSRVSLSTPSY